MQNALSQVQQQKLTQEQIQQQSAMQILSAKLVELPNDALKNRIDEECTENPYLEQKSEGTENGEVIESGEGREGREGADYDPKQDYASPDDIPDGQFGATLNGSNGRNDSDQTFEPEAADTTTFYDQMMQQAGEFNLNEHDRKVLEYMIGCLQDDGLLTKPLEDIADELTIYHYLDTTEDDVERMLHVLWQFEPTGVGARNLQECLILQCRKRLHNELLEKIISQDWDDVTHNRWHIISKKHALTTLQVDELRQAIRRLNPRPAGSVGPKDEGGARQVTPDFLVDVDQHGHITMDLNDTDIPTVSITDDAEELLSDNNPEMTSFVRSYVSRGKLFIQAMEQRRQTMLRTMQAIIRLQRRYFQDGDESLLRPMKLEDIAELTHQDLSTISRVCNSKYADTPYGVKPLKWFFSSASKTQDGGEVSTRQVKQALRQLVDNEDKGNPLGDDTLTEMLQKKGYDIARRTVSKYREQMGIPSSRLRRD